jgi:hypothetical protein
MRCLSIMHVIITSSSVCECAESEIPSQAPKFGTAKSNCDSGKRVKASINTPIYRKEQHSQSTWARGKAIGISTSNMLVTQVCPCPATKMRRNNYMVVK